MECFEVWRHGMFDNGKLYASVTSLAAARAVARLCKADLEPGEGFYVYSYSRVDIDGYRIGYKLD